MDMHRGIESLTVLRRQKCYALLMALVCILGKFKETLSESHALAVCWLNKCGIARPAGNFDESQQMNVSRGRRTVYQRILPTHSLTNTHRVKSRDESPGARTHASVCRKWEVTEYQPERTESQYITTETLPPCKTLQDTNRYTISNLRTLLLEYFVWIYFALIWPVYL